MFEYFIKNLNKDNRGFTLIELVVVIAILGILAAIAIPKMTESRKNAAITAHNANVRTLKSAANTFVADKGIPADGDITWQKGDASKTGEKGWGSYLEEWPEAPNGTGVSGLDGTDYTVTIGKDGSIKVKPDTSK